MREDKNLEVKKHNLVLENKIYDERQRIVKKTNKKILLGLKNKEEFMSVTEIEDLLEIEYEKPIKKDKNNFSKMMDYFFN